MNGARASSQTKEILEFLLLARQPAKSTSNSLHSLSLGGLRAGWPAKGSAKGRERNERELWSWMELKKKKSSAAASALSFWKSMKQSEIDWRKESEQQQAEHQALQWARQANPPSTNHSSWRLICDWLGRSYLLLLFISFSSILFFINCGPSAERPAID